MAEPEKRPVGRPRGPETAIVNLRVPVDLLQRLDRYIDALTVRTGDTGINRATVMREALTVWLEAKGF
jgi:hypothetical protein